MVRIEVLGPGCSNCKRLEEVTRQAVAAAAIEADIVKVHGDTMGRGVMSTPGLVIDGTVVSAGRVPSESEIAAWLTPS